MYIPFDNLPKNARVWVYQSNRTLSASEMSVITTFLADAIGQWAAHGAALKASYKIVQNRFVIVALDENHNAASGCSIDASTHWLKSLGNELNIDFFDRSVVYLTPENTLVAISPFTVKAAIEKGDLLPQTPIFTQQVADIAGLENWPIAAENVSQYKRFFKTENATS